MMAFLLGTALGRWLLLGTAIACAVGAVVLVIYRQGEAAAAAAAGALILQRASAAARARATVDTHDPEAMRHDPYNRDRSR
jgi:hypothetical protein